MTTARALAVRRLLPTSSCPGHTRCAETAAQGSRCKSETQPVRRVRPFLLLQPRSVPAARQCHAQPRLFLELFWERSGGGGALNASAGRAAEAPGCAAAHESAPLRAARSARQRRSSLHRKPAATAAAPRTNQREQRSEDHRRHHLREHQHRPGDCAARMGRPHGASSARAGLRACEHAGLRAAQAVHAQIVTASCFSCEMRDGVRRCGGGASAASGGRRPRAGGEAPAAPVLPTSSAPPS